MIAALLATVLSFAGLMNPEPTNIPAHTHFIRAGELTDSYYMGRQFKWKYPGCSRYRDCKWNRIDSVEYFEHGPFIPEYDGGPRVWIHFHSGPHSAQGGVVLLVHHRVLVRGEE